MQIDLSQFRQLFLEESAEHLEAMESSLLKLRTETSNADLLHSIFRAAHSIKGGAGTFGFSEVVRFTHTLEGLLDRLRSFEIAVTDQLIDILLESVDILRNYFKSGAQGKLSDESDAVLARLEPHTTTTVSVATPAAPATKAEESKKYFRIKFRPEREMLAGAMNPILLLRNLRDLGEVKLCTLDRSQLPSLSEMDPSLCYLSWTVDLETSFGETEIREVFEFVEDQAEILIERLNSTEDQAPLPAATTEKKAAEVAPTSAAAKVTKAAIDSGSIRIATEKIDRLIDLVGELTIAHSMAAQMLDHFTPEMLPRLREAFSSLERHTRDLHERAMSVRMLPVGSLFQRYVRVVHDIARNTGKQISLVLQGEDTEIDKSVLEQLGDPLTHLIRNAADHGLESPEERIAAGKDPQGTIRLCAYQQGGKVILEISDDGRGMNTEKIRQKAIQSGLISADAQLSEEQLRLLIFEPGFSTCDQVSDLSGRGVGMDVVRRNVQALNGTIAIDSQKQKGSTIRITLPLTLAILEGLLVRVAERTLVLPLLSVLESISPRPEQIINLAGQGEVVILREEPIPLLRMNRYLGILDAASFAEPDRPSGREQDIDSSSAVMRNLVIIVEHGVRKIALFVDELLGQQQVVIKSLDRHFRKVDGLMGATILGDGCVAPIMDIGGLAASASFSLRPAEVILQKSPSL